MKRYATILIAATLLFSAACRSYSPELHEEGEVIGSTFMPANHGSTTTFSSKGSVKLGSIDIPAVYAVVFKCAHGQFVIQGEGDRYKRLWEKLPQGTKVDILYREVYNGDGDDKRLEKLDFLDANPIVGAPEEKK